LFAVATINTFRGALLSSKEIVRNRKPATRRHGADPVGLILDTGILIAGERRRETVNRSSSAYTTGPGRTPTASGASLLRRAVPGHDRASRLAGDRAARWGVPKFFPSQKSFCIDRSSLI
jgi:hypothetical protein